MQEILIDYEGNILPRNLAVITIKQITTGGVIQLVVRDSEGDWQFLPYLEEVSEADALVVGLGRIVDLDPSILDTLKMPCNHKAWRDDRSSVWHYTCMEEDEDTVS